VAWQDSPILVTIALHADSYAHCAEYVNLRETLEKHPAYFDPMGADELRRAIETQCVHLMS